MPASEHRTEALIIDLLDIQGWQTRLPPKGTLLRQNEYAAFPHLKDLFAKSSKSGGGAGYPDFMMVEPTTVLPVMIIEAKADVRNIDKAISEACDYADAAAASSSCPIAIGVAGQEDTAIEIEVRKKVSGKWQNVIYDQKNISWIPTKEDAEKLVNNVSVLDLTPKVPRLEVLFSKAEKINRILRECKIRDEYRPGYVGAMMLSLWASGGKIRRDKDNVLNDINKACEKAFKSGGKADVAHSLHVDEANDQLAAKAWEILNELEKLNVVGASFDHDYLGQLYELFFRYTGGNSIGQYFTPRHITRFMADICQVAKDDKVLDPACGTGGFLIAALQRVQEITGNSYEATVQTVRHNLIGFETEPMTAALCVANMILRGDGKSGVHKGDCFTSKAFPKGGCDVALVNPPFPHRKTDTPTERFIDRSLEGLKKRGRLAVIVPGSFVTKREFQAWRNHVLSQHTLLAVCQLPDELFQPYASATTCIILLEAHVPHSKSASTVFVRLENDGYVLKKRLRSLRSDGTSDIHKAVDAIVNKKSIDRFAGSVTIGADDAWAPGAYIPSTAPSEEEIKRVVDELLRRNSAFYVRYAQEVANLRRAVEAGELTVSPYHSMVSPQRQAIAAGHGSKKGTLGEFFDIFYGLKELHSRDGIPRGKSLIIAPTEKDNGCYDWLEYEALIKPPFVTVAQTGTIGEAFVQMEPCAVNDDCLLLVPKGKIPTECLLVAAAIIRIERWRFNYGRKLTPSRIVDFPMVRNAALEKWIGDQLKAWKAVTEAAVKVY